MCLLQVMNERQRQIQERMDALKARQVSWCFYLNCTFSRYNHEICGIGVCLYAQE